MARKRTRTAEQIVWSLTVKAMASADADYVNFAPQADGSFWIAGDAWAVTIKADGTSETTGTVPAWIVAEL